MPSPRSAVTADRSTVRRAAAVACRLYRASDLHADVDDVADDDHAGNARSRCRVVDRRASRACRATSAVRVATRPGDDRRGVSRPASRVDRSSARDGRPLGQAHQHHDGRRLRRQRRRALARRPPARGRTPRRNRTRRRDASAESRRASRAADAVVRPGTISNGTSAGDEPERLPRRRARGRTDRRRAAGRRAGRASPRPSSARRRRRAHPRRARPARDDTVAGSDGEVERPRAAPGRRGGRDPRRRAAGARGPSRAPDAPGPAPTIATDAGASPGARLAASA